MTRALLIAFALVLAGTDQAGLAIYGTFCPGTNGPAYDRYIEENFREEDLADCIMAEKDDEPVIPWRRHK